MVRAFCSTALKNNEIDWLLYQGRSCPYLIIELIPIGRTKGLVKVDGPMSVHNARTLQVTITLIRSCDTSTLIHEQRYLNLTAGSFHIPSMND